MKWFSCLCISMVEKSIRWPKPAVVSGLLLAGSLPLSVGTLQASELLLLNDAELDGIAAGFLEVTADADAVAAGQNTLTSTFTDTLVIQGVPQEDGYVYSQGIALAEALAIGEAVSTRTGVGYNTDEEVVSVQYENTVETSIVGYVKPRDKKAWNQKKKSNQKKDKKAWNQRKQKKDKKAWNQSKQKKDKKAWNVKKGSKNSKNNPDRKVRNKKQRKNDPNKKAWHKKSHKRGHKNQRKNDPNKKAWRKTPIVRQRDVSTLVVITRVSAGSATPQ